MTRIRPFAIDFLFFMTLGVIFGGAADSELSASKVAGDRQQSVVAHTARMAPWATVDDPDSAFALGAAIIGNGVRAGRHQARLTQQQLAWFVGVSQSAISKLECGRLQGIRFRKLAQVVAELETRSDYEFPGGPKLSRSELGRSTWPALDDDEGLELGLGDLDADSWP